MLSKPLNLQSYVVCQLISGYTERDVIKKCSRVKESVFLEIVEKIKRTIFSSLYLVRKRMLIFNIFNQFDN